jgi:hypothetical protein
MTLKPPLMLTGDPAPLPTSDTGVPLLAPDSGAPSHPTLTFPSQALDATVSVAAAIAAA